MESAILSQNEKGRAVARELNTGKKLDAGSATLVHTMELSDHSSARTDDMKWCPLGKEGCGRAHKSMDIRALRSSMHAPSK